MQRAAILTIALLAVAAPAPAQQRARTAAAATPTTTLERIRQRGKITYGYFADARPGSFRNSSGTVDGYSVALCHKVTEAVKAELGLTILNEDWIPLPVADRFTAIQQGRVDLLCGGDAETMALRAQVSFSIPIFPGGIGALVRKDAPSRLRDILNGQRTNSPTWRASSGQLLSAQTFSVVKGGTAEPWLGRKISEFQLTATVTPVTDFSAGVQAVLDRHSSVFFADRAVLTDAIAHNTSGSQLRVLDRFFTYEARSLVLARGDEAFRLVVDRALSRLFASTEFAPLYRQWFGEPTAEAQAFFRWSAKPE